jgi:TPR repeat protein
MDLRFVLPLLFAILSTVSLFGQKPIPESAEKHIAALARVRAMNASDLNTLVMKARDGDQESQYLLALAYGEGDLVKRDLALSQVWMTKSAEQGYAPAELRLGLSFLHGPQYAAPVHDYGLAERWMRLAAFQGDADAEFWLGREYEDGAFGATDDQEALQWLQKSAEQGLPNAQARLGQKYEFGQGVPNDEVVAGRWFKAAADHYSDVEGVWKAEVELAYMYRDGRLRDSPIEAYKWLAIVDRSVVPPISDDTDQLARKMSKGDVAEAQRLADDWLKAHSRRP